MRAGCNDGGDGLDSKEEVILVNGGLMSVDVKKALNEALYKFLQNEIYLLRFNVNERSISHKLAIYLEPYFSGWDVDCEYNRNHDDPKLLQFIESQYVQMIQKELLFSPI